jgi:hypothetical protein
MSQTPTSQTKVRAAPTPARRRSRGWWLVPFAAVWLLILSYMLSAYLPPEMRTSRIPVAGHPVHYWLLVAHIGTATIATLTGFAQFWPWLRRTHPRVHRYVGRAYFFAGVFPSLVLAVPVALLSSFGLANMAGLLALDAAWAVTAVAGLRAAVQGRYPDHRRWMIRNFAVTLASLASRPWQLLMSVLVFGFADSPIYHGDTLTMIHDVASSSVWLALAGNLVVVELYLARRYPHRVARAVPRVRRDTAPVLESVSR